MTRDEYKNWQKQTIQSKNNWILDEVRYHNTKDFLFYTGGESGVYLQVSKDGIAEIGEYNGAIPHIGEAIFSRQHSRKLADNADEALRIVTEKLGMKFLLNFIGVTF